MQSFIELAQKAETELQAELSRVKDRSVRLDEKATVLASTEASLEEKRIKLEAFERQLNVVNEEVSRKQLIVISAEQAQRLRDEAAAHNDTAGKRLKEAESKLLEATQKLDELLKREIALSEREKTYKEQIELDVMRRFAFGKN